MQMCAKCETRMRRWGDSYCRLCRNEIVRLWKAKQKFGKKLDGYKPYAACEEKRQIERGERVSPPPAPALRATPRRLVEGRR